MAGRKLVLGQAFTDTSLPKLHLDPVLPDTGALMLIDPTHPANPWATGVPADQAVLPNIASVQAAATIGIAENLVTPKLLKPAGFTGSVGLLERSGRGGLHGISAQTGTVTAYSGPAVAFPLGLISYFLAHPTNSYYLSVWERTTRVTVSAPACLIAGVTGNGQQTNCYIAYFLDRDNLARVYPTIITHTSTYCGGSVTPATGTGNKYFDTNAKGHWTVSSGGGLPGDGTNTTITGLAAMGGAYWGSTALLPAIGTTGNVTTGVAHGGVTASPAKEHQPSWILYRMYVEDLTVSGRSYATVSALDQAEYTKQVLTSGGRYYGDTYTDPTTIP